jgi:aerobic-type carbon monoxide dehydrogenase small subunit (CoxS/CutS family)
VTVELLLNGRAAALECEAGEMLLDVLQRAGVTSVRATCGIGVCGACTVLLDGEPVSGCLTLAPQVARREVVTVEGLGGADPVQRAFVDAHAFQCGWCTPGFVLTAKRLLEESPDPSDGEIAEALGGNLCRCGSYVKIADAVRRGAAALREPGRGGRPGAPLTAGINRPTRRVASQDGPGDTASRGGDRATPAQAAPVASITEPSTRVGATALRTAGARRYEVQETAVGALPLGPAGAAALAAATADGGPSPGTDPAEATREPE